jgi:hypothetical protein
MVDTFDNLLLELERCLMVIAFRALRARLLRAPREPDEVVALFGPLTGDFRNGVDAVDKADEERGEAHFLVL